jgi:hypothetical protein
MWARIISPHLHARVGCADDHVLVILMLVMFLVMFRVDVSC